MPAPPNLPLHIWRPLHPLDSAALRTLHDEAAPFDGETPPREQPIRDPAHDTIAAVGSGGRIAAYGIVAAIDADTYAFQARVHPDYRGRGLGRYLVRWAAARATTLNATIVDTYPAEQDAAARHLLERAGWHEAGQGAYRWQADS